MTALEELLYRQSERDLRVFVKRAWKLVEPSVPFVSNWHIDAICDHLMAVSLGHVRQLLINIPPRHSKSIITSVMWPAWEWVQWPHVRTVYTAFNEKYLIRDSIATRRVLESQWYRARWADRFGIVTDQNTKMRYENDQGGFREVASFRAGVTGGGGDKIVVDDPNDLKNQDNLDQLERDWDIWTGVFRSRINDPRLGARVIIQQRMNDNDISGRILTAMEVLGSDWVHLCLPAEFDPRRRCFTRSASARPITFKELENPSNATVFTPESPYGKQRQQLACRYVLQDFQDPRTTDMELLNPVRFGLKEIDEIKNGPDGIGEWRFAGQFNQDPVPREGAMFPRDSFMRYTKPPIDEKNRLVVDEWLMSWDMAFKELSDNDYVVGTVWVRKGIDYYLVDVSRGRRSVSRTCAAVIDLSNKWPYATRKLVEDKANGPAVIDLLKDRVPGLEPVEPLGGKLARANAVEPIVASRHVWIPDHLNKNGCWWPDGKPGKDGKHGFQQMDTTWVENYLKEMERFPKATFDDQVDSTTQAINWWIPRVKLSLAKPVSIGMSPSMWAVQ